jgi:hypothetical protein
MKSEPFTLGIIASQSEDETEIRGEKHIRGFF